MKKVLIMDATRSECIEAIRKDKMKKSTYGSDDYPMYECGSDIGYYVQIQAPGSLETTLIEGSKPSTKTKSGAWGRVWYKGSYLKQFSGPLNVVRQELVKYLQQLTTDSHPLKTYKIKNHDSGKTYIVKAVSYTDAKMKYNAHILKDSITEDSSFNALYQFRKELKALSYKSDEQTIRSVFLKAETIAKQVESSIRGLSAEYKTKLANLKKDPHNKTVETEYHKVAGVVHSIKNALIDCAQFFRTPGVGITSVLSIWNNGRIVGQRFEGRTDKYLSMAKKYHDRFLQLYQQLDRTLKDSLTEDDNQVSPSSKVLAAVKKAMQELDLDSSVIDRVYSFMNANIHQTTVVFTKPRFMNVVYEKLSGKFHRVNKGSDNHLSIFEKVKPTGKVLSGLNALQKAGLSVTADIEIDEQTNLIIYYPKSITSKAIENLRRNLKANENEVYQNKYKGVVIKKSVLDSITEDADIAQTDIKSTYLPEDVNADNIQYLGFNEKRKLSFYGYGDRYFVHYDLEGRTEEVDKETVQKILKKNILGEIDENDLINKEPQAEEIVSDAFEDASTSVYAFKQGQRADAFKQYLRDRGLKFEPSQDGRLVIFVVFNADEAVDRRAIEITRTLRDTFKERGER